VESRFVINVTVIAVPERSILITRTSDSAAATESVNGKYFS